MQENSEFYPEFDTFLPSLYTQTTGIGIWIDKFSEGVTRLNQLNEEPSYIHRL